MAFRAFRRSQTSTPSASDLELCTSRDAVSWLRTLARGDSDSLPLGMSSPEGSGPTPPAAAALRLLAAVDRQARVSSLMGRHEAAAAAAEVPAVAEPEEERKPPLAHTSRISVPDSLASALHAPSASPEDQPVVSVVLKVNEHVLPFVNATTVQPGGMAGSRGEGGLYQV